MAEFVDALIAKKYPGEPAEHYADLREQAVQALDNYTEDKLIGQLTEEQQQRLNELAEADGDPSAAFLNFFIQSGIDFNQIMQTAMLEFANSFLNDGTLLGSADTEGGINE